MKTQFSENINENCVHSEYPRMQMVRESYFCLNGLWDYQIKADKNGETLSEGTITVPFSPECELSGVNRILKPNETLYYFKHFTFPDGFYDIEKKEHVLLHFGAVDHTCEVFLNGTILSKHIGGYTSFECDITKQLLPGENVISLIVTDATDTSFHQRGKQTLNPKGIWYTPQSGIWQSVWAESVPEHYIKSLIITPEFDNARVLIETKSDSSGVYSFICGETTLEFKLNEAGYFNIDEMIEWSPENPYLYEFSIVYESDRISSYFGMRKFEVKTASDGYKRFFLNNKPYFLSGVLDQGYWPDGLYTPPSDEAFVYDIKLCKSMGFNMLRKHIKIEPMRWYYHCDRIGMIVWQDMINGGEKYNAFNIAHPLFSGINVDDHKYSYFARNNEEGRNEYYTELSEMINQLYNVTCISTWVPFNEGWGQFDSKKAVDFIRNADGTRTIDHASGWHDQGIGDYYSRHVYFVKYKHKQDKHNRAVALTEFGGYKCLIKDHTAQVKQFGYKSTKSPHDYGVDFAKLYTNEILPAVNKGLCVLVYTQLSDVEGEINGFVTYDRKVVKLNTEYVKKLNDMLYLAANSRL